MDDILGIVVMVLVIGFAIYKMAPENKWVAKIAAMGGGGVAVFMDEILALVGLG